MKEFTKEKEVGSISKVLSLKPPAFFIGNQRSSFPSPNEK